jgi:hypothetical protein
VIIGLPFVAEDAFLADQLSKFFLYGIFALSVDLVWGFRGIVHLPGEESWSPPVPGTVRLGTSRECRMEDAKGEWLAARANAHWRTNPASMVALRGTPRYCCGTSVSHARLLDFTSVLFGDARPVPQPKIN